MDAAAIPKPSSKIQPFPVATVEAKLREELIEVIKVEASIRGISLPTASAEISSVPVHVDSLVVVSILCAVDPIVGFELPDRVVRAGGYVSVESALEHLLPRLEREWVKRKGVKP